MKPIVFELKLQYLNNPGENNATYALNASINYDEQVFRYRIKNINELEKEALTLLNEVLAQIKEQDKK